LAGIRITAESIMHFLAMVAVTIQETGEMRRPQLKRVCEDLRLVLIMASRGCMRFAR